MTRAERDAERMAPMRAATDTHMADLAVRRGDLAARGIVHSCSRCHREFTAAEFAALPVVDETACWTHRACPCGAGWPFHMAMPRINKVGAL